MNTPIEPGSSKPSEVKSTPVRYGFILFVSMIFCVVVVLIISVVLALKKDESNEQITVTPTETVVVSTEPEQTAIPEEQTYYEYEEYNSDAISFMHPVGWEVNVTVAEVGEWCSWAQTYTKVKSLTLTDGGENVLKVVNDPCPFGYGPGSFTYDFDNPTVLTYGSPDGINEIRFGSRPDFSYIEPLGRYLFIIPEGTLVSEYISPDEVTMTLGVEENAQEVQMDWEYNVSFVNGSIFPAFSPENEEKSWIEIDIECALDTEEESSMCIEFVQQFFNSLEQY